MVKEKHTSYDLLCVGGGIMSATLALLLKMLDPGKKVLILERLPEVAQESSGAWNNSGTGHSGMCELNYTPEADGKVDISKAIEVFTQFERSKQFWAHLVEKGFLENPREIIHPVPHCAWVRDENNVAFLKKRFEKMSEHLAFENMSYTENPETMAEWFGLIMKGQDKDKAMAATRSESGTEINYGALTQSIFNILAKKFNTPVYTEHEVHDVSTPDGKNWTVKVRDLKQGEEKSYQAQHLFLGAGGGALPLLQKTDIEAQNGYGGFPVSGQWLVCNNREVIEKYHAKVYSKAGVDAPPMSAPHLDTRFINSREELMFGPFAGLSSQFLKKGSKLDLPKAINFSNLPSYWGVFWHNLPLTKYLLEQAMMNHEDRMEELREFIPGAKAEDWDLKIAGQRVQVIKRDEEQGGSLEFGTDVVYNKNGTVSALLGASPGASVAVHIMLQVLKKAFPGEMKSPAWQKQLTEIIPFWNRQIEGDEEEFRKVRNQSNSLLDLV